MSDLSGRIFATWPSAIHASLPELCDSLLSRQISVWPGLAEGYAALQDVRKREIPCDGYSVFVQHNPKRFASTTAKVDDGSRAERACFLCPDNLPPAQQGILFQDEFLILCNPAPIFKKHYTIVHREHIPQQLNGRIGVLLDLARDLSPEFTLFYNGPKCGASMPDHLHFQASPMGAIPIERLLAGGDGSLKRRSSGAVSVATLERAGRPAVVIQGTDALLVRNLISRLLVVAQEVLQSVEEPMVNVLFSFGRGVWSVLVFLRRKHRPEAFFKEGDDRVLISPAAVDIGGLLVAPLERDFERLDADMVRAIYNEVLVDAATVDRIVSAL